MKKTIQTLLLLALAAAAGGFVALYLSPSKTIIEEHVPASSAVRYADAASLDFTLAAASATPAVVHISAGESQQTARRRMEEQRRRDPFSFFFGDQWGSMQDQFHRRGGSGSGVIIDAAGYIVTNNHVIEGSDEIEVSLNDKRKFMAKIIGSDPKTDLAVLKIDGQRLPAIDQGDSDDLRVGQWALAVGNPFSYLRSTVTAGIISAIGRDLDIIGDGRSSIESFIQTDAAVNPGNSGGALVDAEGRLIGINTAIATPTGTFAGYSFAIPVNLMRKIVDDIIQYGSAKRGYLGVLIQEMDGERADELGLDDTRGVYISEVEPGGAAQYAGVLPKDVIVAIDGRDVKNVPDLQAHVGAARIGDELLVTVNRRGKIMDFPVRIAQRD